eukprot:353810-Chlamydomonas_euryale.AAC.5
MGLFRDKNRIAPAWGCIRRQWGYLRARLPLGLCPCMHGISEGNVTSMHHPTAHMQHACLRLAAMPCPALPDTLGTVQAQQPRNRAA